ncbi:MAG TPA: 1-deoxy-D-xylulose-5-phosphate reductoisomerase [Burkholderiales bacterium]|nr:1-deoxy-D-xylulose-5-phosphate reductoisomerase [Burkholderiales bacterium]
MNAGQPQNIVVLGSTGSIGVNTLDVIARHREHFHVVALTAQRQADRLFEQCVRFAPDYAVLTDADAAGRLERRLREARLATRVLSGDSALETLVALPQVDTVMAAIVGIAGLRATYAAACGGKRVLLANKEALVTAGGIFMNAVREHDVTLIPIDSEHNAVFQVLPEGGRRDFAAAAGVRRILLTASGGPFRTLDPAQLTNVTPEQACAHPNWVMGRKISVDSATMMNKGLEVIEASWLFGMPESNIDVVIHPESVVHSLVEYIDGSLLAQLGNPDMRTPIAFALGYPQRIEAGVRPFDLAQIGSLNFVAPDAGRFPCLSLARQALRAGGSAPALLNAANEVAVAAFLARALSFNLIPALIEHVLATVVVEPLRNLDDVFRADRAARECAQSWLDHGRVAARALAG